MKRLIRIGVIVLISFLAILTGLYTLLRLNEDNIRARIVEEVSKKIDGEVRIGRVGFTVFEEFPNFSILVHDVYLRGPRYDVYHRDFVNAKLISIRIQLRELLWGTLKLKNLTIHDSEVLIFRTADGYSNLNIFQKKKAPDTTASKGPMPTLDLEQVSLENFKVSYFDSAKNKSYGIKFISNAVSIESTDTSRIVSIKGKSLFGGLMFNGEKGSYIKDKNCGLNLNLEVIPRAKLVKINPSSLQFDKSLVQLGGVFKLAENAFVLDIRSERLDFGEGISLLTEALQSKLNKASLSSPVDLTAKIDGSLAAGMEPKIDLQFATTDNVLVSKGIRLDRVSFEGGFSNHIDSTLANDDHNSRLNFSNLKGEYAGIQLTLNAVLDDLKSPSLDLAVTYQGDLQNLNAQADSTKIYFQSGTLESSVKYKGTLAEYMDSTLTSYSGKLQGEVRVGNASWSMPKMEKQFTKGEVAIRFNEHEFTIDKVNVVINDSPIELKGTVTGFVPFFFNPKEKGHVNLSVYSPHLDLAPLIKKKKAKLKAKPDRRKLTELIDALYEKVEFDVSIKVDELTKGAFRGRDFESHFRFMKDQFSADPIRMKIADGRIDFKIKVSEIHDPVSSVQITADAKNLDVSKFMHSFGNFSIKAVKSNQIRGKITLHTSVNAKVDEQFRPMMPTVQGETTFSILNGQLDSIAGLVKIGDFLFKNRDFYHVQFAEIKGNVGLAGNSVNIRRMEVQSNVLSLFIEGKYSLVDSTDLSVQIPLSNLKKRDKDFKPENVGPDAKVGPSVFLRLRSKDGKLAVGYDLLKKFKKKK